jgi:hypothetical protein
LYDASYPWKEFAFFQDGLVVENMHDIPYQHTSKVGPEITACMAVICHHIKKFFKSGKNYAHIVVSLRQNTVVTKLQLSSGNFKIQNIPHLQP